MPWTDPTNLLTDAGDPLTSELVTALKNNASHARRSTLNIKSFTVAGSYTWVVPPLVELIRVTLVSGGQAGTATISGESGVQITGSYVTTPGATMSVVVGAGGLNNGQSGGNSTFGNTALGIVTARGDRTTPGAAVAAFVTWDIPPWMARGGLRGIVNGSGRPGAVYIEY